MSVKITTKKNDLPKMEKYATALNNRNVNVGYLDGGEQAWLAGIHEYGCRIEVTPKMRAWLHHNGLHLKKSTTHIVIPERSFLRSGFDQNHEKVIKTCEKALSKSLVDGNVEMVLDSIGLILRDKIVDYGINLKTPKKHPFTLQRNPGKTNPLVVSGDMLQALTYEVE